MPMIGGWRRDKVRSHLGCTPHVSAAWYGGPDQSNVHAVAIPPSFDDGTSFRLRSLLPGARSTPFSLFKNLSSVPSDVEVRSSVPKIEDPARHCE